MIEKNFLDLNSGTDSLSVLIFPRGSQGIGNEDGFVLSGVSRLNLLKKNFPLNER